MDSQLEKIKQLYIKARSMNLDPDAFMIEYKRILEIKQCNLKGICVVGNPEIGKIYYCENI